MADELAIEDHLYDFLADAIAAAPAGSLLADAELHDHVYRKIDREYGIRIADGDSDLEPSAGATTMLEFDGVIPIVVFSLVTGPDRSDRRDARARMIELSKAVAKLFIDDPTMGGRVNDSRVKRWPRGWDSIESKPYSVANAQVLINETGGLTQQ